MIKLSALSLKKKLIVGGLVLSMSAGAVTAALTQPQSTGADTSPIVQQVNHNTEQLDNHEDRITNSEQNIKDLQNKTDTPSNSNNVTPRSVSTPAAGQPVVDSAPVNTAPTATATPSAPAQTVNPRTILRVFKDVNAGTITCRYELQNGETTPPVQLPDCQSVGDVAS